MLKIDLKRKKQPRNKVGKEQMKITVYRRRNNWYKIERKKRYRKLQKWLAVTKGGEKEARLLWMIGK